MDSRDDCEDFDPSLEPVVIINDGGIDDENFNNKDEEYETDPLSIENSEKDDLINSIGPEISIIPVKRKRPQIKIRLFEKRILPF
ncbi:hypothetical protein NQ314_004116 [Rhamnusium bicolor]|uniref:Uncharacterized protein n=1 Tax=Rhamnusium bicolor TaxID=1586634 RepID=A0AAV8ZN49_9CUCU|nr:hypothetical protein NQ314_004116 [Rhamnusium bicolor]